VPHSVRRGSQGLLHCGAVVMLCESLFLRRRACASHRRRALVAVADADAVAGGVLCVVCAGSTHLQAGRT
jgi:hypothetical protein